MCEDINIVNDELDSPEFSILEPRLKLDYKHIDPTRKIKNHHDAIDYVSDMIRAYPYEASYIVLMDGSLTPLGCACVGTGTSTVCPVSVAKIIQIALLSSATGVILIHNHPDVSEAKPSQLDIDTAHALSEILRYMDGMVLYDSVIVSANPKKNLYSMRHDKKLDKNPTEKMPLMSRTNT